MGTKKYRSKLRGIRPNWSNKNKSIAGKALDYLDESRSYIFLIIGLFVLSGLIGFFFSNSFTFLNDMIKNLIKKVADLNGFALIAFIFWNNVKTAFFGIILGIILGIFPVVNAIINGVVLGYVLKKSYASSGINEFWRVLPHGIFELPAIFISLGLGLKIGMFLFSKNKSRELKARLTNSLILFVLIIIPLLIIAAIIEGLLISFYK